MLQQSHLIWFIKSLKLENLINFSFLHLKVERLLDFDVHQLSVTADSVSPAGDSQRFMVCCGARWQIKVKGTHVCDGGVTCLAVQGVSMVSLPALCCASWALALGNQTSPGVHQSANARNGGRQLLGLHRPFGSIGALWFSLSLLMSFTCIICCVSWERMKEGKFFSRIYPDFSLAVSLVTLRKSFNFPCNLIAMAEPFFLLPTFLTTLLEKKGFYWKAQGVGG